MASATSEGLTQRDMSASGVHHGSAACQELRRGCPDISSGTCDNDELLGKHNACYLSQQPVASARSGRQQPAATIRRPDKTSSVCSQLGRMFCKRQMTASLRSPMSSRIIPDVR
jgi:hypothetical protein